RRTPPDYYLDLVAMATVADMVPLLGENRILVKQGLERLNTRPRPGLSGLIKECRIKGPITPRVISFRMAPKINALGRIGDPKGAMQLLLSRSYSESRMLARELLEANRARQEIEQVALEGAQEQSAAMAHSHALILQGTDWHPGVIGTIATRISTETGKPTIVLTAQDSEYFMGSARSSNNVNILKMLDACAHLLERHGGHPNAAGLVIHKSRFEEFSRLFLSATKACGKLHCPPENLNIEAWLGQESLTPGFFQEVSRLSPFGYCNPEPMVGMKGVLLGEADLINKRHLRFSLDASGGNRLEAFVRDCPDWELDTNSRYDLAFMPQIYHSPRGPRSQLKVVDIKTCEG
ncbi:MAG: DHHA1 domain-containing protein, partial [Deltaproteobacteria bacterium]|nr:DHHA1 domain-containing protein [Deltaproteobacteria bacterium]